MCRLLGIVSSEPTEFRLVLRDAPKSLAALSKEHPDGWGLAVFGTDWNIQKGTACASEDERFHEHAIGSSGVVLVSHIRQKTVGPTAIENTHPFRFGKWVFAHNGTIRDRDFLRDNITDEDRAWITGETDSELFFAYLIGKLRSAGIVDTPADAATDRVISDIVTEARARPDFGALNFLLSNGETVYAHRFGRSMYSLIRGSGHSQPPPMQGCDGGVELRAGWTERRRAVFIASECITDEAWTELRDGTLVRLDRGPTPSMRTI